MNIKLDRKFSILSIKKRIFAGLPAVLHAGIAIG
jgi:hypothetical protein